MFVDSNFEESLDRSYYIGMGATILIGTLTLGSLEQHVHPLSTAVVVK